MENKNGISGKELEKRNSIWPEFTSIDLSDLRFSWLGSTSLSIPKFHIDNTIKNFQSSQTSDFQYQNIQGRTDLRESILQYFPPVQHYKQQNIELSIKNMTVTPGAMQGISMSVDAFVKSGEEVIMIEPIYCNHLTRIPKRQDVKLRTCKMTYDSSLNTFVMDFDSLKNVLNEKSRLLVICNPNNPMGKVWAKTEYEELAVILEEFPNVIVMEDAAYFLYLEDEIEFVPFGSLSQKNFDRSLTFFSGGKTFNVTGLRAGIVFGREDLLTEINKIQYNEINICGAMEQIVLRDNFKEAFETNFYEKTRIEVRDIVHRVMEELDDMGIKYLKWDGSYYIMIDVENTRNKVDGRWYYNLYSHEYEKELDKAFARMMAREYKVGLLPLSLSFFDENPIDRYVRIALNRCEDDVNFLLDALRKFSSASSSR